MKMIVNAENRCKVLMLEDEPIIGRAVSRSLASRGFDVEVTLNGLIAKEKIDAHNQYEFLICDIKTPVMNGIQLFEYLQQQHHILADRVIFTSGDSLGIITKQFIEKVARPFLSKPYTPTQLLDLIAEVFNLNMVQP
jgi:CheY-like chemotaxis protein